MADPFYGEIRIFGFNYAPENWAFCNGQQMLIQQASTLFAVIGNAFGSGGPTTFKLPNLQGNAAMGAGQGPGLTNRSVGGAVGQSSVSLDVTALPGHQHQLTYYTAQPTELINAPAATAHLARTVGQNDFTNSDVVNTNMSPQMMAIVGGGAAHENRQPFLAMNFCICLSGEYPPRP